jgi:hypothetical protein
LKLLSEIIKRMVLLKFYSSLHTLQATEPASIFENWGFFFDSLCTLFIVTPN